MSTPQNISARSTALLVLNKTDPAHDNIAPILNRFMANTNERARATDLVFGTIRNRASIDHIITSATGRKPEKIQNRILNVIRLAAYELIFAPATAQYAIVNEAANNTAGIAGKKQVGFVNACLRQITRMIENRDAPLESAPQTKILPQNPSKGCLFKTDILPDPHQNPTDYYSQAFSLPKWLISDWLRDFHAAKLKQICFASNRKPAIYIRINPLKTTIDQLADAFTESELDFEIVDQTFIAIKPKRSIPELPGFDEGLFTVQDITASKAVTSLDPKPGEKILDLCAAPGGKTIQLAEATGDKAHITATDIDPERLKKVRENIDRLQIKSVNILPHDSIAQTAPFDCILLDVPCSNTGVLAKRPEVRYRISEKAIELITKTQKSILQKAAPLLAPKGRICYSTCSIQSMENDLQISLFLRNDPRFELTSKQLTFPSAQGYDHDGGFIAILTRL